MLGVFELPQMVEAVSLGGGPAIIYYGVDGTVWLDPREVWFGRAVCPSCSIERPPDSSTASASPRNAAAPLEALRQIQAHPEKVQRLHERSALFLKLARERASTPDTLAGARWCRPSWATRCTASR